MVSDSRCPPIRAIDFRSAAHENMVMNLSLIPHYIALMRLDKPVGIWLVFYPAAWAVALASTDAIDPVLIGLLLIGAVLMRSAGCVLNDITDRRLDVHVERTKNRPLAAGTLTLKQAYACLFVLLALAFGLLFVLPHNPLWLALIVLPMVAAYPFMKRITWWPQMFLGLTFNTSALFGWYEASGELPLEAFILYASCVFWTLGYDTIYALQDMEDDEKIGIKSTARRMGNFAHALVAVSYTLMVALWAVLIVRWNVHDTALLAVAFMAIHLIWQWRMMRLDAHELAGRLFKSNATLGLVVFVLLLLDRYDLSHILA